MATTVSLELDKDTAQELALALGKLRRAGKLEAELVDALEQLNALRVAQGWLSPARPKTDPGAREHRTFDRNGNPVVVTVPED